MRNRVHQISLIGCLSVLGFLLFEWIVAIRKHAVVPQVEVISGFCVAWAFAICHHWTKPRSPITTRQSGRLRHVLHRSSLVLCLVCVGMLPVGFLISATERGELIEHHYSGCVTYAMLFAVIYNFTQSRTQETIKSNPETSDDSVKQT